MKQKFCNQTEFAALMGVGKSYVTRLKQAGRLVMTGGLVDVAASLERIKDTADPARAECPASGSLTAEFQHWRLMKLDYLGRMAKLEYEVAAGILVPLAEATYHIADACTLLRNSIESLPDRISYELTALNTADEIRALLTVELEQILQEVLGKITAWGKR